MALIGAALLHHTIQAVGVLVLLFDGLIPMSPPAIIALAWIAGEFRRTRWARTGVRPMSHRALAPLPPVRRLMLRLAVAGASVATLFASAAGYLTANLVEPLGPAGNEHVIGGVR